MKIRTNRWGACGQGPRRRRWLSGIGGGGGAAIRDGREAAARVACLEPLEPRLLLSADLSLIGAGLNGGFFSELQAEVDATVLRAPAPLVGSQLADYAEQEEREGFLEQIDGLFAGFLSGTSTPLIGDVADALRSHLGELLVAPADGPDIAVLGADGADEVQFQLTLGGAESLLLDLDLALGEDPVIAAKLDHHEQVDVDLNWTLDLTFGATASEFFFVTSNDDELTIDLYASLAEDFLGKGRVGVFISELEAADEPSFFEGTYQVDVQRADGGDRLTLGDGFEGLATAGRLSGAGEVNLHTYSSFLPMFLDIGRAGVFNIAVDADTQISYELDDESTDVFNAEGEQVHAFGPDPTVDYTDVSLDLGTFYNEFIQPIVTQTQQALQPLKPLVDFLTEPVPLFSDLMSGEPTVLDLAIMTAHDDPAVQQALEATQIAVNIIDAILSFDLGISEESQDVQALGSFSASAQRSFGDDADEGDRANPTSTSTQATITQTKANQNAADEAKNAGPQSSREFQASLDGAVSFPIFQDPSNIFKLLIGDTTPELFLLETDFDLSFTFDHSIPLFKGLVHAELELTLGASVDLTFGYDAYGVALMNGAADFTDDDTLRQSLLAATPLLADGFYFDDNNPHMVPDGFPNVSTVESEDTEQPEATLSATLGVGLSVGPSLEVLEFKAGLIGTFGANILFDLNDLPEPLPQHEWEDPTVREWPADIDDPNFDTSEFEYDGRVRFYELQMAALADPFGVFNTSGELVVGLDAFVTAKAGVSPFEFTLYDERYTLFEAIIFQFNIFSLEDIDILRGVVVSPPKLGEVVDGELRLFMGDTATQRENSSADRSGTDNVIDERFSVRSLGPTDVTDPDAGETIQVVFAENVEGTSDINVVQQFENVRSIRANVGGGRPVMVGMDGQGNPIFENRPGDNVIVVDRSVAADVYLTGGMGDDRFSYAGGGRAELRGVGGDNILIGGPGDDLIIGGMGNDRILGRGGDDELHGVGGDNTLDGGEGNNILHGGVGDDLYLWSVGTGPDQFKPDPDREGQGTLLIRGGTSVAEGGPFGESVTVTEVADTIDVSPLADGSVLVATNDGDLVFDDIENLTIAAGGGGNAISFEDLSGTSVELVAIDLGPAQEGPAPGSTIVYEGSGGDDHITVHGAAGVIDATTVEDLADPLDDGAVDAKPFVRLMDTTSADPVNVFIVNSWPKDHLTVLGRDGNDTLAVAADPAGSSVRVQDLLSVTLDGGPGDDILSTVYNNTTVIGGSGTNALIVSDGGLATSRPHVTVDDDHVLVRRDGQLAHVIDYADIHAFTINLGAAPFGTDLVVERTIFGGVTVNAGPADDDIHIRTLQGPAVVNLNAGDNAVRLGKNGTLALIEADVDIRGGSGYDTVIYDNYAATADLDIVVGLNEVANFDLPGHVTFDDPVDEISLVLGSGDDFVDIPDLTRRITADGGSGDDELVATLSGMPSGKMGAPGVITFDIETVRFFNEQNPHETHWLIHDNELRSGQPRQDAADLPGVDIYLQQLLRTHNASDTHLDLAQGRDRLLVWSTVEGTTTHVNLRDGEDELTVGEFLEEHGSTFVRQGLIDIRETILIDGGGDADLIINDRGNQVDLSDHPDLGPRPGFIAADEIRGMAMAPNARIGYSGFRHLDAFFSDVTDYHLTVEGTGAPIRLDLGDNSDTLVIDAAWHALEASLGGAANTAILRAAAAPLTLYGSGEADRLIFQPGDPLVAANGSLLDGALAGDDAGLLVFHGLLDHAQFAGFADLTLDFGDNSDTLVIDKKFTDVSTFIHGNGGDDHVIVRSLGDIVNFSPGSGFDTLTVEMPGHPAALATTSFDQLLTFEPGLNLLEIDNEAFTGGPVTWTAATDGLFVGDDPQTRDRLLDNANAQRTHIATGSGDHHIVAEELANRTVTATIDGDLVELISGELVLENQDFLNEGYGIPLDAMEGLADVVQLGGRVYAVAAGSGAISVFEQDGAALKRLQVIRNGDGPFEHLAGATRIIFSADGQFAYVAAEGANAITVLQRDAATGELSFVQSVVHGSAGVQGLLNVHELAINGNAIYALGQDALAVFSRNASSGTISQLQVVRDQALINVAISGTASQSSGFGPAERAIDGNLSPVWTRGSITHTDNEIAPWWSVQFDDRYDLAHIYLFNRGDGSPEAPLGDRLTNFQVRVYDGNTLVAVHNEPGTVTAAGSYHIELPEGTVGDRVMVQLNEVYLPDPFGGIFPLLRPLSLAQVEVYQREVQGVANATSLTVSDDGERLYLTSSDSAQHGAVSVFDVESSNTLRYAYNISNTDDVNLNDSRRIVHSPDGRFVYTAGANRIQVLRMGEDGSAVERVQEFNFTGVNVIDINPNGSEVYFGSTFGDQVRVYKRNAGTGELSLSQTLTLSNPRDFAPSDDGRYLYVAKDAGLTRLQRNQDDILVREHSVGTFTFTMTQDGTPVRQAVSQRVHSIDTTYDGRHIVMNMRFERVLGLGSPGSTFSRVISMERAGTGYSSDMNLDHILSNGLIGGPGKVKILPGTHTATFALIEYEYQSVAVLRGTGSAGGYVNTIGFGRFVTNHELLGSGIDGQNDPNFSRGGHPRDIIVSEDGNFAYIATDRPNNTSEISAWSTSSPTLVPLFNNPLVGKRVTELSINQQGDVYVVGGPGPTIANDQILRFETIGGLLLPAPMVISGRPAPDIAGAASAVEITEGGVRSLYVLGSSGQVQQLAIGGGLEDIVVGQQHLVPNAINATELVAHDQFLYVLAQGSGADTGIVHVLERLDVGDLVHRGAISNAHSDVFGLDAPARLNVTQGNVYVAAPGADAIVTLGRLANGQMDPGRTTAEGDLTPLVLSGLEAVTLSPDGNHLYAVNREQNALVVLDAASQELSIIQTLLDGVDGVQLAGARHVAISPDGNEAHVAAPGNGGVSVFSRDAATGELTFMRTDSSSIGDAHVLFAPNGSRIFVEAGAHQAFSHDGVFRYVLDPAAGEFRTLHASGSPFVAGGFEYATAFAVGMDDLHIFVTFAGPLNELRVYQRTEEGINPEPVQVLRQGVAGVRGVLGANAVAVSPDGDYVYVAGQQSDAVAVFRRADGGDEYQFAQFLRNGNSPTLGLKAPDSLAVRAGDGQVFVGSSAGVSLNDGGVASFVSNAPTAAPDSFAVSFRDAAGGPLQSLSLLTDGWADFISLRNPAHVLQTLISTGQGNDVIDLARLGGVTLVDAGAGDNLIDIRSGDSGTQLTVVTGDGDNEVNVRRTGADSQTSIATGAGVDTFYVAGSQLQSDVQLFAGPPSASPGDLLIFDTGDPTASADRDGSMPGDGVIRVEGHASAVQYHDIEHLQVIGPANVQLATPDPIFEGEPLTLDASDTDTFGREATFAWDLTGDGFFGDAFGETITLSWDQLRSFGLGNHGQYQLGVRVTVDDEQLGDLNSEDVAILTILNTPPTIHLDAPSVVDAGEPFTLDFFVTDPGDLTVSGWVIDWGDGSDPLTLPSDAAAASYAYDTTGTFNGSIQALDAPEPVTLQFGVEATAPTPDAGGPYLLAEGDALDLAAQAGGSPTLFEWDLTGNGVFADTAGAAATLVWDDLVALGIDDAGTHQVAVRTTYADGASAESAYVTLQVANTPPTAMFTHDAGAGVMQGDLVTLSFTDAFDPSPVDQQAGFTYSFDFNNDGTLEVVHSDDPDASFTATVAGTQVVRGVIADKDGGQREYLTSFTVQPLPPTLHIAGDAAVDEGSTYTLDLSATHVGDSAIEQWIVKWGDGTVAMADGPAATLEHVYTDGDADKVIHVTAIDDNGVYAATHEVSVMDVPPTLTLIGAVRVDQGQRYTLYLDAFDPGLDTITQWTIDWGDGHTATVDGGLESVSHTYMIAGEFDVVVTATDPNLAAGDDPYTVSQVAALADRLFHFDRGIGFTDNFYLMTSDALSHTDAAALAEALGGHLVSVGAAAEENFLKRAFLKSQGAEAFWIGLTERDPDADPAQLLVDNLALGFDADEPGDDANAWFASHGSAMWDFTGPGANVPTLDEAVDSVREITSAFNFAGSGDGAGIAGPALGPATGAQPNAAFELWLRPDQLEGEQAVFEAGDASLAIKSDQLVFRLGDRETRAQLTADQGDDFVQVVGSIRAGVGASDLLALYVNGQLQDTATAPAGALAGWAGVAPAALGGYADANGVLGEYDPFAGQIAQFRFYDVHLNAATVAHNFFAIAAPHLTWSGGDALTYAGFDGVEPLGPTFAMTAGADGSANWATYAADDLLPAVIEFASLSDIRATSGDRLRVGVDAVPPSVSLSGAGQVNEGAGYRLRINPPTGPTAASVSGYIIDWGDGSDPQHVDAPAPRSNGSIPSLTVNHVYADGDAQHEISVQIVDEHGVHDNDATLLVDVADVPPMIQISGPGGINVGSTYQLELGPVVDPGADVVEQIIVHWGDGNTSVLEDPADAAAIASHTYMGNGGQFTIEVDIVQTVQGETATFTGVAAREVTVNDVDPEVAFDAPAEVDQGSPLQLTLGPVTHAGGGDLPDDILGYRIHWGDGSPATFVATSDPARSSLANHTYLKGPFNFTVRVDLVRDGDDILNAAKTSVFVRNTDPQIDAIDGPDKAVRGQPIEFTGLFTDYGVHDTHQIEWQVTAGDPHSDANMTAEHGSPRVLTMRYVGGGEADTNATQGAHWIDVSGDDIQAEQVRIVATNRDRPDHPGSRVYFDGEVGLGELFEIDALQGGKKKLEPRTFVHIFDADGELVQTIEFRTHGPRPLVLEDRFGAVELVGYIGDAGTGQGILAEFSAQHAAGEEQASSMQFTPRLVGEHTVRFTVTDDAGGTDTATHTLNVKRALTPDPAAGEPTLILGSTHGRGKITLRANKHDANLIEVHFHEHDTGHKETFTFAGIEKIVIYSTGDTDHIHAHRSITIPVEVIEHDDSSTHLTGPDHDSSNKGNGKASGNGNGPPAHAAGQSPQSNAKGRGAAAMLAEIVATEIDLLAPSQASARGNGGRHAPAGPPHIEEWVADLHGTTRSGPHGDNHPSRNRR